MTKIKKGVKIKYLSSPMLKMLSDIDYVWDCQTSINPIVTSMFDGKHMRGSLHYKGLAVDIRSRNLTQQDKDHIQAQLQAILGPDYDVVVEKIHFHVEYDPK